MYFVKIQDQIQVCGLEILFLLPHPPRGGYEVTGGPE